MTKTGRDQPLEAARRKLEALRRRASAVPGGDALLEEALTELADALEALHETEVRYRAILETAVDAIITIDEHSCIQLFNPAAERMFGYTADAVIGRNISILMAEPERHQHDAYVARYLKTGEKKIIGIGREVVARRSDGTTFPMELAVSEVRLGDRRLFTGAVRDITERKRAEQLQAMQYGVTRVIAEAAAVNEGGPKLLQTICEGIGWELGEVWFVDPAVDALRCCCSWHAPGVEAAEFEAMSRAATFRRGEGLPGRVWAGEQPVWMPDVTAVPCFLRTAAANQLGLRGSFAFPIRTGNTVVGVLAFFGCERRQPEPDVLEMLDALGRQIGDFIARKRAEETIRDSEARFRNIISRNPDAIIIVDHEGVVHFVNPAASVLLGRPAATLIGVPFGLPVVSGESTEMDVLRPGGQCAVADMRIVDTDWQGEHMCLASLRDITDRKRMEEEVFQLAAIVASSDAAILSCALDGTILSWNVGAEKTYGYSAAEMIGHAASPLLPRDRADELAKILARIGRGEHISQYETVRLRKDGVYLHVALTVSPIHDAEGRVVGASSIARDITDRKRAEAQVRELQKLAQQRERLADVGAITAQIVHDLGNPLAGISMQAQLILRRAGRDRSQPLDTVVQPIERILSEVHRLDSLVKEFMEFSREQRLDLKPLDLRRFIMEVADLWEPVAAAREIALAVETSRDVPAVSADEEKLRRVLDNLLKNAIEAIEHGPGRVGIHVAPSASSAVRISVTDTGPGIPKTVQVFRLFETTKTHGSGIGLAVARQIVLAHRGSIKVASLSPRGTAFHIVLPRAESSR